MATNIHYFTNSGGAVITSFSSVTLTSTANWIVSLGDYHFGIVEWEAATPESTIMFGAQSLDLPFRAATVILFFLMLCAVIVVSAFAYRARQRRRALSHERGAG